MDKNTLGNYGWVVITVIIISIMIALASPFAVALKGNVVGVTNDFTGRLDAALSGIDSGSNENEEDSENKGFYFLQEVDDGVFKYTYMGYETKEDKYSGFKKSFEVDQEISWEEYLAMRNMTEEDMYAACDAAYPDDSVYTGKFWSLSLKEGTNNDITIPAYYQGVQVKILSFNFEEVTTLTVLATEPPISIATHSGEYIFDFSSATAIYVPAESVEAYKNASGWSSYADIIQAIPTT